MTALEVHAPLVPTPVPDREEPAWATDLRREAVEWLDRHPPPDRRQELWRYTDLDRIHAAISEAVRNPHPTPVDRHLVDLLAGDAAPTRVVLIDGHLDEGASRVVANGAVSVTRATEREHAPSLPPEVGRARPDAFAVLNLAARHDAALVEVAPCAPPSTVHVVHVNPSTGAPRLEDHPALVVSVGAGAQVEVVETFVGLGGPGWTNASTTIEVGEGATARYVRVQSQPAGSVHVGHVRAGVARHGSLTATSLVLGAEAARVALDVTLHGEGAELDLSGLHLPVGGRHHDHVVTVEHCASRTTSAQSFRAVVDDRARGSFTGHVLVQPNTAGVSACQSSANLLLTDRAQVDTRPWLEILADDVRCTHGATVGRLDDDALFYLRSRGIPQAAARELLVEAFVSTVLDGVRPEPLRLHVAEMVRAVRSRTAER